MKCNCDATILTDANATGLGMAIHDSNGDFMACRISVCVGIIAVKEAEALALCDSISWVAYLKISHISFEIDSKTVADVIHSPFPDLTEFESIILDCNSLLGNFEFANVYFTRSLANMVAHTFARAAHVHANPSECLLY